MIRRETKTKSWFLISADSYLSQDCYRGRFDIPFACVSDPLIDPVGWKRPDNVLKYATPACPWLSGPKITTNAGRWRVMERWRSYGGRLPTHGEVTKRQNKGELLRGNRTLQLFVTNFLQETLIQQISLFHMAPFALAFICCIDFMTIYKNCWWERQYSWIGGE